MYVRTDLRAGEMPEFDLELPEGLAEGLPEGVLDTAMGLVQSASNLANTALTDPNAFQPFLSMLATPEG